MMDFIDYRELAEAVVSLNRGGELKGKHLQNVQRAFADEEKFNTLNKDTLQEKSIIFNIFMHLLEAKNIKVEDVPNMFENTRITLPYGIRPENIIFRIDEPLEGGGKDETDEEPDETDETDEENSLKGGGPSDESVQTAPVQEAVEYEPDLDAPNEAPVKYEPDHETSSEVDQGTNQPSQTVEYNQLEGGSRNKHDTRRKRRATQHFTKKKYKGVV